MAETGFCTMFRIDTAQNHSFIQLPVIGKYMCNLYVLW